MDKQQKIEAWAQWDAPMGNGLFGLPFDEAESAFVVVPVPWEVTVSYRSGTALGPKAIQKASVQVDLFDPVAPDVWKQGIFMLRPEPRIMQLNRTLRPLAEKYLRHFPASGKRWMRVLQRINEGCAEMTELVRQCCLPLLQQQKKVVVVGGDHSIPLGYLRALTEQYASFGILQLDAHCDLREAFEGFHFSHASIMHHALQLRQVSRLVQVGIRDYSAGEHAVIQRMPDRIVAFPDFYLKQQHHEGKTWSALCDQIIAHLPDLVYVSVDIDVLNPSLCPHTGTPVPGGLEFDQVLMLLHKLSASGKTVIGCDLCEVAPGSSRPLAWSWDANVGARLLFKLINTLGMAQHKTIESTA